MELKDFIKTALNEIVSGVAEARKTAREHGGSVGSMKLYGYLSSTSV